MEDKLYYYSAVVRGVYDGDTFIADVDLGLSTWRCGGKFRLHRIKSANIRGHHITEGLKVRNFLKKLIEGEKVIIKTIKQKKGRYVAEVWVVYEGRVINVNDFLVEKGYAQYVQNNEK